jgi:DNA invertase Pin-like site-specific DNA recombinase
MLLPHEVPSKVTTAHQAKMAYVYIRQSSLSQVTRYTTSTDVQYRLVERVCTLGWPPERVQVIDDDLGQSGSSADQRLGFQRLLAEISLARVGLVTSFDASRFARNNSDWYHLLELCALFGTLIADSEQLYDPRLYHDRLLLGLSGIMSEAELHHIQMRMHAGERYKAERGELRQALPVGLERQRDGQVLLHPDEEIQARLRLVFQKFEALGSAHAVMRYLQRQALPLPTRPLVGPAPHDVVWQPASTSRVLDILHNPAYAGAYVYGRRTADPARRTRGHPHSGHVWRPQGQWPVCLLDHYPAYITWEQYMQNQTRLQDNQNRYQQDRHGVPRKGQALLQGFIVCGRCGARMPLRYSGPQGEYPVYACTRDQQQSGQPRCQEVRAVGLDAEIVQLFLQALEPDNIQVALAAFAEAEREATGLQRQWQLRRERAQYDVDRARRQYHLVEPENRLVARSLEQQWEDKLRAQEELEQTYQRWVTQQSVVLTESDRQEIVRLGADLPAVWAAPTTTNAERKHLVRLLIRDVIVDTTRVQGRVWCRILWHTGATSEHCFVRTVQRYAQHADAEVLQQRVRTLTVAQKLDAEIAAILNAEGFRSARGRAFTGNLVWLMRQQWHIPTVKINGTAHNPPRWPDGTYSVAGVAAAVGVQMGTVYTWVRTGRISGAQITKGMPWKLSLTEAQLSALKEYVHRVRRIKRSKKEVV